MTSVANYTSVAYEVQTPGPTTAEADGIVISYRSADERHELTVMLGIFPRGTSPPVQDSCRS